MGFYLFVFAGLLVATLSLVKSSDPGINELKKSIEDNRRNLGSVRKKLEALKKTIHVTVTAYSPTVEECGDEPYVTAFNKPVKTGSIAISRDLEIELGWKLGDMVHLHGLGNFEVWDRMPSKWNRRVDIFFFDSDDARAFGVRQTRAENISLSGKRT